MSWHHASILQVQHTLPLQDTSEPATMQTAMSSSCSLCNARARQPFRPVQQARVSCTATRTSASAAGQISARQPCRVTLTSRPCGLASLRWDRTCRRATRQQVAAVRAEISYVMIKPDGVQRGLVGEVRRSKCHAMLAWDECHRSMGCSKLQHFASCRAGSGAMYAAYVPCAMCVSSSLLKH